MEIFDFLSDIFGEEQTHEFEFNNGSDEFNSIHISDNDFTEAIMNAPNLSLEHFSELVDNQNIDSISAHLKGLSGNIIAEKYFEELGADVRGEILVEDGRVDLLVSPHDSIELNQITLDGENIILEKNYLSDEFTVEIKTYTKNSFLFGFDSITNQVTDGAELSNHNYLGVTEDFLELNYEQQTEIIESIENSGGSIVLLPYSSSSIDVFINNILTNY